MIVSVAIFSVFLCSVQGNGADQENQNLEATLYMSDHKVFLSEMKGWLTGMTNNMKAQVDQTTQNFQQLPNTLVEDGKAQLALQYAQTLQAVMGSSAPQECITAGQLGLEQLRTSNLHNFLTCKNITTGMQDIVYMGLQVSKLTIQVILTLDEVLNGLSNCKLTWNVFKYIYCTFSWVKGSITDIYKSFEAVSDFTKNISDLISDLKKQIEYCMHGSKATALMDHVQVLSNVQQCATKSR